MFKRHDIEYADRAKSPGGRISGVDITRPHNPGDGWLGKTNQTQANNKDRFYDNHGCNERAGFSLAEACWNNGVLYGASDVRIAQITDGTTNTFMIGERDYRCFAGSWVGARRGNGSGLRGSYYVVGRGSMKLNDPRTGVQNTCTEGFSSQHVGGAYFAMCDGSVRFVDDELSFNNADNGVLYDPQRGYQILNLDYFGVYQRLASRDDSATGEPIPGQPPMSF